MKISKIITMRNFNSLQYEEVKSDTVIINEKTSRLDKIAEIFFKYNKIVYSLIDLIILIWLGVLVVSVYKQNNRLTIFVGLVGFILSIMRYKIGILGYWHLNKDLPIFEKKRYGNDRTNLVWFNVFPKTKEIDNPTRIQKTAFEYLRRVNNQINKSAFSFYFSCVVTILMIFVVEAIMIAGVLPNTTGVILFFITLLCGVWYLKSAQDNISFWAKDNFNVKVITSNKGDRVIIRTRFRLGEKDLYQIDGGVKTKNAPQVIKVLQDFT